MNHQKLWGDGKLIIDCVVGFVDESWLFTLKRHLIRVVFLIFSQYALLLSYFQYCRHMLDPDVPATVLQFLLREEQEGEEDLDIKKVSIFD